MGSRRFTSDIKKTKHRNLRGNGERFRPPYLRIAPQYKDAVSLMF